MTEEELEAPTRKQSALPPELHEPGAKPASAFATGRVPKAKVKVKELGSGTRPAVTDEELERLKARSRETIPAPADDDGEDDAEK